MAIRQGRYFSIFLLPTIIFFVLLAIFPLFYSVILSLTDYGLSLGQSYKFIGIANYSELLRDQLFRIALKNTLKVVGVATAVELIVGFMLATILYSYFRRFRKRIQTLLILPIAMAPVAIALMWKYILNSTYGIANYFLNSFGIKGIDWLGSNEWALISVAIVDIWQWTPFVLIIMLAGIESIPIATMEMAKTDGAGKLQLLRFFMLPQLKAFIAVALLLRVIDAFKLFDTVYVLTEGGPGSSTETLSLLGHRLGFQFFRTGLASAESIILLMVISLLTYVLMKTIRRVI